MTSVGFFSVVRKRGDTDLTVRARVRGDLEALAEKYLPTLGPIEAGGGTDYPYRARTSASDFAVAVARIVEDVDYSNFKDSVLDRQGRERAHIYGEVWSALRELARDKPIAYGGVVIDSAGRILLREATDHYDGYVWTFSKGRPSLGESPREAALRETREETGVIAEVVAEIPGTFAGGTTDNIYFLMRPTGATCEPEGDETASVCWVTPPEKAREMIGETTNPIGGARDLAVLEAALSVHESRESRDRGS
jgi:8-oxo-dGTP pyrophosphatase MutT (NUDIX family)